MSDTEKKNDAGLTEPPPLPQAPGPWLKEVAKGFGEKALGLPLAGRDTLLIVIIAFFADQCLYKDPGGLGMACVLIAAVAAMTAVFRKPISAQRAGLMLTIGVISGMMIWRNWWMLGVAGWVSVLLLAVRSFRDDWCLPGALLASAATLLRAPLRLFGHLTAHYFSEQEGVPVKWYQRVQGRVIFVPLAVTIAFVMIFRAANPVIAKLLEIAADKIGLWFSTLFDFITPLRIFVWVLWVMLFAALIRPVVKAPFMDMLGKLNEKLVRPEKEESDSGHFRTALATLVMVNILFLAYNCLDAVYLYFKAALPDGISWTAYTHSGCGWLTFALFVSSVVTGYIFWNRLNFHPKAKQLKALSYIWAVLNAVLAVGAIRRIEMYINYSGLTHLRITGVYGSLLVMAGLGIMVRKVWSDRSLIWLVRRYVQAFCIAFLCLAVTPNDYICTSYNVRKVIEGKKRALRPICLKELSAEALPSLIPLLDYERQDGDVTKEKVVRRGIAGMLGLALNDLRDEEGKTWRSCQVSSLRAVKELTVVEEKIRAIVPESEWEGAATVLRSDHDLRAATTW